MFSVLVLLLPSVRLLVREDFDEVSSHVFCAKPAYFFFSTSKLHKRFPPAQRVQFFNVWCVPVYFPLACTPTVVPFSSCLPSDPTRLLSCLDKRDAMRCTRVGGGNAEREGLAERGDPGEGGDSNQSQGLQARPRWFLRAHMMGERERDAAKNVSDQLPV